jgi:hypothetical protein
MAVGVLNARTSATAMSERAFEARILHLPLGHSQPGLMAFKVEIT